MSLEHNKFHERLQEIFGYIPIPILIFTMKDAQFRYCNSSAQDLTGYPSKKLEHLEYSAIFSPETLSKVSSIFEIAKSGFDFSDLHEKDIEIVRPSSRKVEVEIWARTVLVDREKLLLLTISDVSEIKKLQREKDQSQKKVTHLSKLADIGQLSAGIAHELNNPLMIIQGFTENLELLMEKQGHNSSDYQKCLSEIFKATDRMAQMIQKMSRIVRNDEVRVIRTNLSEVALSSQTLYKSQARSFGVNLNYQLSAELPVKCDPSHIEQVIVNLLTNAFHAMEEQSSKKNVTISTFQESGENILRIWNSGPKIPEEIQSKILSPFFTTKDVGKGTGLGLSVSMGILEAHEGYLSFESTEEGTHFDLHFPLLEDSIRQSLSVSPKHFLVVDDESLILDALAGRLNRYGHSVTLANSAQQAVQILAEEHIDVLLTDLIMPEVDGKELIAQARDLKPDLMIYGVTGYMGGETLKNQVLSLGVEGVLHKPLDSQMFENMLLEVDQRLQKAS